MEQKTEEVKLKIVDTPLHELLQPQRLNGESFDKYKKRRLDAEKKLKEFSKGKMIWNSSSLGKYVKEESK